MGLIQVCKDFSEDYLCLWSFVTRWCTSDAISSGAFV
jgi:hypothetical protein